MHKTRFILLAMLMFFAASIARSQGCQPTNNNYALNPLTDPYMFSSIDYTQLPSSVTAASLSVSPGDGTQNHTITVGSPTLTFTWTSQNGSSAYGYYTIDGGTAQYPVFSGLSGTTTYSEEVGDIGHYRTYYYVLTGPNGQVTIDRNVVTFVANQVTIDRWGNKHIKTIFDEDEQDKSLYMAATSTISGSSYMDGGSCHQAITATHQPDIQLIVSNSASGESYNTGVNYGNVVEAVGTSSVFATTTGYVSFLPGDSVGVSRTGKVFCTIAGFFMFLESDNTGGSKDPCFVPGGDGVHPCIKTFRTKSTMNSFVGTPTSVTYYVSPFCINVQVPPWDPSQITVSPPFSIPPKFIVSQNTGYSAPGQPGWNFYNNTTNKVYPAVFPFPGYCSNPTAPY